MFLLIYLLVIPIIFWFIYNYVVSRRERKAAEVRTPFSPDYFLDLEKTVSESLAALGDNSELDINKIDEFLPYGLTQYYDGGNKVSHIDKCCFSILFTDWQVAYSDDD